NGAPSRHPKACHPEPGRALARGAGCKELARTAVRAACRGQGSAFRFLATRHSPRRPFASACGALARSVNAFLKRRRRVTLLTQPVRAGLKGKRMASTVGVAPNP